MSWTGREAGLVSGDVFVWTLNGRPEVVGCVGSLPGRNSRGCFHEFHALTVNRKLQTTRLATGNTWRPDQLALTEVPGAGVPAESAPRRLAQMRSIARQFSPRMHVQLQGLEVQERQESDGGFDNLRLLPQPLYRHDRQAIKGHKAVVDGALFSYVWTRGTDPELILLLEARKTPDGLKWFYAPLRFTFRELWLKHKGVEVWHDDTGNGRDTYARPYVTEWAGNFSSEAVEAAGKEAAAAVAETAQATAN